jgi:hypothetical protein
MFSIFDLVNLNNCMSMIWSIFIFDQHEEAQTFHVIYETQE